MKWDTGFVVRVAFRGERREESPMQMYPFAAWREMVNKRNAKKYWGPTDSRFPFYFLNAHEEHIILRWIVLFPFCSYLSS